MNTDIRLYVNNLFHNYEPTLELEDFKEEIIFNLQDRIDDLQKKGYSSEDAFTNAVSELGNITEIADDFSKEKRKELIGKMYIDSTSKLSISYAIAYTLTAGVLLFGLITSMITFFATDNLFYAISTFLPFLVPAGATLVYLVLTTETSRKHPMHRGRALIYAIAVASILFGATISTSQYFMENSEAVAVIGILIPFLLPALLTIGFLLLTEKKRLKPWVIEEEAQWEEYYSNAYQNPEHATKRGMLSGALWVGAIGIFIILWMLAGIQYAWIVFIFAVVIEILIESSMYSSKKRPTKL
ncbi:permease prefix domain 1-containing protein [Oceanobacillus sp. 1P07AA]|uniref:permease prefix domain 1-containing protein n=1 Tax=Oceanobacillus sp. 1P07AA TaxID=3132293 RepID=UPI0039A414E6